MEQLQRLNQFRIDTEMNFNELQQIRDRHMNSISRAILFYKVGLILKTKKISSMEITLINDKEYQKRFEEIKSLHSFNLDNGLKVKYSERLLDLAGEIFDVFPPPKRSNKMKAQSCYSNAFQRTYDGYQYVEGIIVNKYADFKISHAWNIDRDGKHIDFTILNTHDYIYHGIIVPKNILFDLGFKNGGIWYCSLPYLDIVV